MKNAYKLLALAAVGLCAMAANAFGVDLVGAIPADVAVGLAGAGAALTTTYKQAGDVIQYAPAADVSAGSVVKMGNTLGVALVDLTTGVPGSVAVGGVHVLPKVSAAVIKAGESLTWDVSANSGAGAFDDNAATPASGDVTGAAAMAFEDAGNGVTSLAVKLTGVPGTVTA